MAEYKDTYNSGVKIRVNSNNKNTVGSSPLGKGGQSGSNDNYQGPSPFFHKPLTALGEHRLGKAKS